jgi:RNA polymerase sigma-70 factor (ECF subfamily)
MTPRDPATPASRTAPLADEEAIIARAANGDRSALPADRHYQSACYGLAWRILGDPTRPPMAQDAFVHAATPSPVPNWRLSFVAVRITANAAYDILRRAQRRPTSPLPEPEEGETDIPDPFGVNPLAEAARSELYRALDAALRLLPEDQRMAVVLCDVYGMDYQEVSVVIQSPVGTVKSRIHRGRLRLRELLADQRELFEG